MIHANPMGLCSWDFSLNGEGLQGETRINFFTENGSIHLNGDAYEVRKQGLLSGKWVLEQHGKTLVTAHKENPFTRTIGFTAPGGAHRLSAQSMVGRTMVLTSPGSSVHIAPEHPFTRRATLSAAGQDPRVTVFAFWVTILLWRRADNNNNS